MVYHTKSENVKKLDARRDQEIREVEAAVEYERAKAAGEKPTLRRVARQFGVDKSTVSRRVKGKGKSILEFNAEKQKLTPTKENILVEFILESAHHGFPMENSEMKMTADAILMSKFGPDCELVGESWVYNFKDRHSKKLQTFWSSPVDSQRAASLNPTAVQSFQNICEEYIVKLGVPPELIFGMDESGFPHANTRKTRVVGARGTKTQHKQGGAD
jgi:hypothetical protein